MRPRRIRRSKHHAAGRPAGTIKRRRIAYTNQIQTVYAKRISATPPGEADKWGKSMGGFFGWLGSIFSTLKTWILDATHWLLHTLLPDMYQWINRIRQSLQKFLQPLINYIKFEKAWLDQVFNNVIKPMLKIMQEIRSVLVVFRLMGFKWASALDGWIAGIESRLVAGFLRIRGDLNTLANWINYVIDPTGLFNVPLLLLSMFQTLPQLFAALAALPQAAITDAQEQAQAAAAASGTAKNAAASVTASAAGVTTDTVTRYQQVTALYQNDGYQEQT